MIFQTIFCKQYMRQRHFYLEQPQCLCIYFLNLSKQKGIKSFSQEKEQMRYFLVTIFFETKIRKFWAKEKNSKSRFLLFKKLYNYLPQFKNSRYFKLIKDFYKTSLDVENDLFTVILYVGLSIII